LKIYKIIKIRLNDYWHLSCHIEDNILEYDIKNEYLDLFLNILKQHSGEMLGLNFLNSTFYLDKFIKEEWIYELNHEQINPVKLAIEYLKNPNKIENYLVEDTLSKAFSECKIMSDAELISNISINLLFKNRKDKISLFKINSQNYVASKQEYLDLCAVTRKKYDILKIEPLSLDDIFLEISSLFFTSFMNKKEIFCKEINRLAYASQTNEQFQKSMLMLCGKNSKDRKNLMYLKDGYVVSLRGTMEKPNIKISCLSYNYILHGYKPKHLSLGSIISLKNKDFWEEAWYEFLLKHEDNLELLQCKKVKTKCSEKYNMTLGEIAKKFEIDYGIKLTEATIGNIEKRALRKIKAKLVLLGITQEDYGIVEGML